MTGAAFSYSGTELDAMAGARNYYAAILECFGPHLGDHVVEVGAGIGTFASMLLDRTRVSRVTLVEPAENNFPVLSRRFAGDSRVQAIRGYLADHVGALSADSILMINVAEHVEDDVALFRDAHGALKPGGKLLLFVPALMSLYGSLDKAFGHVRRYSRAEVEARLGAAGFQPLTVRYANSLGVLAWFMAGRVMRWQTLNPGNVKLYDTLLTPLISRLERLWTPPFGQSVLAIARR